ncbi:uncharacterized protein LOC134858833 isoform X2 [Eleginops maclovinus]|uniref:uncharacterized protein LOC134858833 isoform X2 n=1 Tax=Eleginops maclovinus TaxID=56733 RepID=UPI0030808C22
MAGPLRLLLILAGLTGIHTVAQVSKVSVKVGDSITTPCLYDLQHRNQVKCLCKGGSWLSCSTEVRTDSKDMAVHLGFLLILTGITGIHSLTKISIVSARAGASISIPCLYDSQYINHVKYLCKGYYMVSCSYAVKTNQPSSSGKFSISDDKKQRVFTVTINHLTEEDASYYWCAVEINDGSDFGSYFELSVKKGPSYLYVDQQKRTGFRGDNIKFYFHYQYAGGIQWCRLGSSCVTRSNGWLNNSTVTFNITVPGVLTVTMSGLRTESSGWYMCVKGDLQMPVHINVTEKPTTVSPTSPKPVTHTSSSANQTLTKGMGEQQSFSVLLMAFTIPLSLLIFFVIVALFIWFMCKRQGQSKKASSATIMASEEVTNSTVKKRINTSVQWSKARRDVDVMYSYVVAVECQTGQRQIQAEEDAVTYSRLTMHQNHL